MSTFDDLVGQYEQPSDVEIFLPTRGLVGNKGGNNAAANAAPPDDKSADSHAAGCSPFGTNVLHSGSSGKSLVTSFTFPGLSCAYFSKTGL